MARYASKTTFTGAWTYWWINDIFMLPDIDPNAVFPMSSTYGTAGSLTSNSWEIYRQGSYRGAISHTSGFSFGTEDARFATTGDSFMYFFYNASVDRRLSQVIGGMVEQDLSVYGAYGIPCKIVVPNFDPTAYTGLLAGSVNSPQAVTTGYTASSVGIAGSGGFTKNYSTVPRQPITCMFLDSNDAPQDCTGAMGMIHVGMIHGNVTDAPLYIDFLDSLGNVIDTAELGYYNGSHPVETTSQCSGKFTSQYVYPDSDTRLIPDESAGVGDYGPFGGTQIFWYEGRCSGFQVRKISAAWPNDRNPATFHLGAFGKHVSATSPPLRWNQRDDGEGLHYSNRFPNLGGFPFSSKSLSNRLHIGDNVYE